MQKVTAFVVVMLLCCVALSAQDVGNTLAPGCLYRASFVQAAPGKLLEFIDLQKQRSANKDYGDEPALWMRHSQGDRWDLMLLYPMGSYAQYYSPDRVAKRSEAAAKDPNARQMMNDIAWQEDLFVHGPCPPQLHELWENAGFFHLEIFQSLPGKQDELIKEREMENAYLKKLNQPTNLIFTRVAGATWDCFTIGFYRDLQHYAESAKTKPEDAETAAKAAGFKSSKDIGPYLRTLIALHHDTLAVALK